MLSEQLEQCLARLNDLYFKRTLIDHNSQRLPFQSISDDLPSTTKTMMSTKYPATSSMSSFVTSSHRSTTFIIRSTTNNGLCRFLTPAVVQQLDGAFFVVELGYLHAQTSRTPEEAYAQLFIEACQSAAAIIYIPDIENLRPKLSESVQCTFISNLRTLPSNIPDDIDLDAY